MNNKYDSDVLLRGVISVAMFFIVVIILLIKILEMILQVGITYTSVPNDDNMGQSIQERT